MIVLAIHDGHDAGVCLLRDGNMLYCSSEERRRNEKNFAGVPELSVVEVFKRTGIDPRDVDMIALSGRIRTTVPTRGDKPVYSVLGMMYSLARSEWATSLGQWALSKVRRRHELLNYLESMDLGDKPIIAYDHHRTHAACAYYHRPWDDDALVLTLDGAGDGLCATVSVGSGTDMRVVARTPKFHSPAAWMYSAVTAHLGLRPYEHEYKVMGMAPYGRAEYVAPILREMFGVSGLNFRNRTGRIGHNLQRLLANKLYGQRFDNVSAGCQLVFEEMMLQWVGNAVEATGITKVAGAGGAFLNVKANKLIREMDNVDAFYAYPASDDGGTPIGAAILGYLDLCKRRGEAPSLDLPRDMYLGVGFTEAEMQAAANESGLPFTRSDDQAKTIAQMLASGQIVARFDGREEVGPRALGNRSILADARDLRQIRKLNFAIKKRDFWMPFAASILEEDADKYIENLGPWPYWMIEAFDTKPAAEDALLAGMHPMDMTIRPQLVNDLNPGYRDMLRAYRDITGVGGVLNTSFNLHGFPIVGSPKIALDTLLKSDLDGVALGPFMVTKPAVGKTRTIRSAGHTASTTA
jgi:carbamoyltransferase